MAPGDDARAAAPHAAGTLAGKLTSAGRDGRDERTGGGHVGRRDEGAVDGE